MILSFISKYRRIMFPVLLGLAVVGMVYGVYSKGLANGYSRAIEEFNAERLQTINDNIEIRKEQDRIVPFDGKSDFIDGLRNGKAL